MSTKWAVFLGNPGRDYERTRHNAGWLFLESLPGAGELVWQKKFKGEWAAYGEGPGRILFLKPLTFMNLSGESARAMTDFHKIPPQEVLVVHDDMEVPRGEARLQKGGGLGGHNGLRSLKQHWGTGDFHRLRLGIGRPDRGDPADFVLGPFAVAERGPLEATFSQGRVLFEEFRGL